MRKPILRVARFILWAGIYAVTLETFARLEDSLRYGAPFLGRYDIDTLYMNDSGGLKQGRPHSSYLKWKLNEAGFRGPALRNGRLRIVCMGSSETFGLYESENGEWPRQLERILNEGAADGPVEVVNTAFPGMSIESALRRLPNTMGTLHPDIVLIYPSYASYISLDDLKETGAAPPSGFEWRMKSRLETMMKASLPTVLQDRIREIQLRMAEKRMHVLDKIPEENVKKFADDTTELIRQIREYGALPILITHATRFGPTIGDKDRPYLVAWRKFYPSLSERGFPDMERRMSAAVRKIGQEQHIAVIDTAGPMKPGAENFVEFVHFTDEGARALAGIVAKDLTPIVKGCLEAEARAQSGTAARTTRCAGPPESARDSQMPGN